MNSQNIRTQLEGISLNEDFAYRSEDLCAQWADAANNLDVVETVLRFMEDHSLLDFGVPGALVHFVEDCSVNWGYEKKLIESVKRKPTAHTIWMLNRIINNTRESERRTFLIQVMQQTNNHTEADQETKRATDDFLRRLCD